MIQKKAPRASQAKPDAHSLEFLKALLEARSPSGYEFEAQAVIDRHLMNIADTYKKDALGNRIATLNPSGDPVLMLAGHMDELGLIVKYIDDKGFIYFDTIGGHDLSLIPGRKVQILTRNGTVIGVTGKRAIHTLTPEERKKVPEIHDIWIDIGATTQKEALKAVAVGDPIVYEHGFFNLQGSIIASRAMDNKVGCYVVCETLRRLVNLKKPLQAQVVAVATTQEEVGTRGATTSSYAVNPHLAIAVDVGHATDHPDCDKKKLGEFSLGKGPIISRGPNINPIVFEGLLNCAHKYQIPYQIEAEPKPTGTDARVLQMARQGVATGLISVPLRYMHTPTELVHTQDIENAVILLVAFAQSLKPKTYGHF